MATSSGNVIWITGLSGAGKSTISSAILPMLKAHGRQVVMLDGDELRMIFGAVKPTETNHGRNGRLALAMQYAHLCRLLAEQGMTVIIATISLFHEVHAWNRANLPGYFEVYIKVPIEELRRRDPKGIYKRFDEGLLNNVAGLDLAVDEPLNPDMLLEHLPASDPRVHAEKIFKSIIYT